MQRFQDSNERTDKSPWIGLRRVSVKRGIAVYLFLKNAVLGLWLGLTLTLNLILNLTITITLTLKQHSLKKKKIDPDPGPAFYWHPFAKRIVEEAKPNPHGDIYFFFAKKRVVLRQDQWRADIRPTALSMDRGRSGSYWDEICPGCCVTLRAYFFFIYFIFLLLFLDFHFILEVVVPQDNNRNCWRMLKTTEHHRSSSARIIVALAMDSRPKPPSLSYPAFQCISVHGV